MSSRPQSSSPQSAKKAHRRRRVLPRVTGYLVGGLFRYLAGCQLALLLVYALADVAAQQMAQTDLRPLVLSLLLRLVSAFVLLLPASLLIAVTLCYGRLAASGELKAMAALGASRWRRTSALWIVGGACFLTALVLSYWAMPLCEGLSAQLDGRPAGAWLTGEKRVGRWQERGGWFVRAEADTLLAVRRSASGGFSQRLELSRLGHLGGQLTDYAGRKAVRRPITRREATTLVPLVWRDSPRPVAAVQSQDVPQLQRLLGQARRSYPLACIVVVVAAIALVGGGPLPALPINLLLALAVLFVLWLLVAGSFVLARSGFVAPGLVSSLALLAAFAGAWAGLLASRRRWLW